MFNMLRTIGNMVYEVIWPPKKKPIPPKLRNQVWEKYHGKSAVGACYTCGTTLNKSHWHCSHVVAEKCGGKLTIDNLRVCCATCNVSMRKMNLYTYMYSKELYGPGRQHMLTYIINNPLQFFSKR